MKAGSYSYGLLCDSNPDVNLTGPFGTGYIVGTSSLTLKAPVVVGNAVPAGSCYIDFPFYSAKNLYTAFGPAAQNDSDSWLKAN